MNKQITVKIIIFGLVQWFLLMVSTFVISLIYGIKEGAKMTAPPPLTRNYLQGKMISL